MIGFVIAFVDIGIKVIGGATLSLDAQFIKTMSYYVTYATILTLINVSFFDYLNHKVVWKKYRKFRLLIGAIGSILLSMLGVFSIRLFTEMYFGNEDWETFISGENPVFYAICLLITIVASLFFHAVYFYKAIQNKKVKEQKIIAGTASAKFDALKNQLDPHFLFNSLNVLTSLIEEDPDQAQKFTTSLSKVYRYVLEQKNKDLVSVDEELQ